MRSGCRFAGGSDCRIPRAVRTKSQMVISVGPTVQIISNFRFPKYGRGSPSPVRCRKRIKLTPTMLVTITRITPQITSTTLNRPEIAAACDEALSKMGLKLVDISFEEKSSFIVFDVYD